MNRTKAAGRRIALGTLECSRVPVKFIFRCQFCDAAADPLTQMALDHYGTIGFHPWKRPPYPSSLASADTDHAWNTATRRQRWSGF